MRKFFLRGLLYLSPLLVGASTVFIIDPYSLFTNDRVFNEKKFKIGYGFDQGRRYKIFTYLNNPQENIILGASEINIINERNIPETGWHSLSYGGAPLRESLNMYWEIKKVHSLNKVIIAPEFIKYYLSLSSDHSNYYHYNFNWKDSQSEKAFEIYRKKYTYFTDEYSIKSTWAYIISLFNIEMSRGKPKVSKTEFWTAQLDYAKTVYSEDVYNSKKKSEIRKLFEDIKEDAKNDTEISIVIPIQHIDLLKLEYGDAVYKTYVDYIQMLTDIFGTVHYFAYTEDVSRDNNAFDDPFHCNNERVYIDALFNRESHIVLNNNNVINQLELEKMKIEEYE